MRISKVGKVVSKLVIFVEYVMQLTPHPLKGALAHPSLRAQRNPQPPEGGLSSFPPLEGAGGGESAG